MLKVMTMGTCVSSTTTMLLRSPSEFPLPPLRSVFAAACSGHVCVYVSQRRFFMLAIAVIVTVQHDEYT